MKKYFTTYEYRKYNARHAQKSFNRGLISRTKKRARNRAKSGTPGSLQESPYIKEAQQRTQKKIIKPEIYPPEDFRLIENTEECLSFFREIRSENYINYFRNYRFITMSLVHVKHIDYAAISALTAISDHLKYKKITLRGNFPEDTECKQILIDSGFLDHMFDDKNRKFPKAEKSDLIFFEKGSGILSNNDNMKISLLVKNVVRHLTGEPRYSLAVKTIILEICGNSIEWSGTESRQWLLGAQYEKDRVTFTVTDVGKGILETLYRKLTRRFFETFKSNDEILVGAFEKKYGSSSQEGNRNKGLPAVKANFDQGNISRLKVLTNNVILHFDDSSKSRTFSKGSPRFRGTFYQWEMTNDCLNKLIS